MTLLVTFDHTISLTTYLTQWTVDPWPTRLHWTWSHVTLQVALAPRTYM